MPRITLPDGSIKEFSAPVTGLEVARSIGERLAKEAVAVKVEEEYRDLSVPIDRDAKVWIITSRPRDEAGRAGYLYVIRHSAAHVMAEAIQRIVPGAQLVYGPPVENGFYYDIRFPEGRPLRADDFAAIEAEVKKIQAEDRPFTRYDLDAGAGVAKLKAEGSKYKLDNAERALAAGSASLSWYCTGEPGKHWEDLCRGPHVKSTGATGAIKVMSLASAYWHGDEKSDSLTRVYGTAFPTQAELDAYLNLQEEAKQRDHRVIGKKLHLFHIDEVVGQGLILWTPKGSVVRHALQTFISEELVKQGYVQVYTPNIGKLDLFKTSGHFPYYQDKQYPPILDHDTLAQATAEGCSCADVFRRLAGVSEKLASGINERTKRATIAKDRIIPDEQLLEGYLLKPMNCPFHAKIFGSSPHSYRDMPVRLAEFGTVYRWEQSGELNGMTRVRGFTQDDAHLFCTAEQVPAELLGCLDLVKTIFKTLGIKEFRVRVGLRDPDASKYTGDPAHWDAAEEACRAAARTLGVSFSEEAGEAAFYGPKIDFVVKDVIGRDWQLGTVQVDYGMANRFDLSYIGPDNKPHRPVVIHRAPFGSMERFIGVLIEHFAGAFPLWLSPEQVRVLPISDKSNVYAAEVLAALKAAGLRATMDDSDERVQGKIKKAAEERLPYMAVVGPRDAETRSVSVRVRGVQKDSGAMPLEAFVAALREEHQTRAKDSTLAPASAE
jgi:threonyl-tRNA synthetase